MADDHHAVTALLPTTTQRGPWVSNNTAQRLLTTIHFAYPVVLLVFFMAVFTIRSIVTSSSNKSGETTSEEQLGPGGKPLPKKKAPLLNSNRNMLDFSRPRKLLFEWISLGVALTFVGNSITVIVHALYARSEEWWCGQAPVVSIAPLHIPPCRCG